MITADDIRLHRIAVRYPDTTVRDLPGTIRRQLSALDSLRGQAGKRIAITAGSRGIAEIPTIIKAVAEFARGAGMRPFVVAAMGSHGGGTEEGQLAVLRDYGISEAALGIPVLADTRSVVVGNDPSIGDIIMNRAAFEADGIIVVNRVKKHTDIHAPIESGLAKMLAIGLGGKEQAERLHYGGLRFLEEAIPRAAEVILATGKVIAGLAIVENAARGIARVEAIPPPAFIEREKALLRYSKRISPKLPVRDLDVLLIDRGGKDLSGSCIDTNIIGRMNLRGERELKTPRVKRVVVFDLSDKSEGNAAGIGLADFITRRFHRKIDFASTNVNSVSCYFPERGLIPIVAETDAEAVGLALATARNGDPRRPRIIRIRDTMHLDEMYVSDAILDEIGGRADITVLERGAALLDPSGELRPF